MEDMTLREVCTALGVSRRAVQGYENESLITATEKNNRGYLLYDSYHSENIGQSFLKRSGKLTSSKYITLSQGRNNTMKKRWLTGITILTMTAGLTAYGETAKTTETTDSSRLVSIV